MAQHNLGTVIRFEVVRTLSKRRFWVATLLVPVLLIVVFLLVFLSNTATDETEGAQKDAQFSFDYTDASGLVEPAMVKRLGGKEISDPAAGIAAVKDATVAAFFLYPKDPATDTIKVYGVDKGLFANGQYASVAESILQQSALAKVNAPQLTGIIQGNITIDTTTFKDGAVAGGMNAVIPAMLFVVIFYVVILLLGGQMLNSTLEEKENRVTEMILTTIRPTSLILGKVISLFIIGIVQMLVFAVPVVLAHVFFRNQLSLPDLDLSALVFDPQTMIVGTLVLIGGFALFTTTLVALGAAMPTAKDAGPVFGAMMLLIFIPFYIISLIISDPGAVIVQIFSYFPYSAPITALLRNAFGTLPLWQAIIIIVMLFGISAVVLRIAVKIFQYGSIEYSRKVNLRDVFHRRATP
ncbi:ABC transporter permease [Tessaracoccus antarcticus]|uniref:ABC transporter permease n=1 Tax=Tessaracoccus antarcticus TaxID=2479848 RepID=A0A3M0G4B8_9ACTN|nr:ABC transporter permease [Tessaracoccus antarcticus]RMB58947.1 ABC transporter permease [Tessaracoccus antarcticus]